MIKGHNILYKGIVTTLLLCFSVIEGHAVFVPPPRTEVYKNPNPRVGENLKKLGSFKPDSLNKESDEWVTNIAYVLFKEISIGNKKYWVFRIKKNDEFQYAIIKNNRGLQHIKKDIYVLNNFLSDDDGIVVDSHNYSNFEAEAFRYRGYLNEASMVNWNIYVDKLWADNKLLKLSADALSVAYDQALSLQKVSNVKNIKDRDAFSKGADNYWSYLMNKYQIEKSLSSKMIDSIVFNPGELTKVNEWPLENNAKLTAYSFTAVNTHFLKNVVFLEFSNNKKSFIAFDKNLLDKILRDEGHEKLSLIFFKRDALFVRDLQNRLDLANESPKLMVDFSEDGDLWNMPSLHDFENLKSAYLAKKNVFFKVINAGKHLENKINIPEKISFIPSIVATEKTRIYNSNYTYVLQPASDYAYLNKDLNLDDFFLVHGISGENPCLKILSTEKCVLNRNLANILILHKDDIADYLDPNLFNAFNYYLPRVRFNKEIVLKNGIMGKDILYSPEKEHFSLNTFKVKYLKVNDIPKNNFIEVYINSLVNPGKFMKLKGLRSQILSDLPEGYVQLHLYQLFFSEEVDFLKKAIY